VLDIPERGSSAHRQLAVYQAGLDEGLESTEALCRVVDWLMEETINGV
jgi:carboxylate-amine ligase